MADTDKDKTPPEPPTPDTQTPPDLLAAATKRGKPVCPVCGGELDVYEGVNPAKAGTGFCVKCGARRALKG